MLERPLKPIAGLDADSLLEMTEASYIDLVQWTGAQPRADKRSKLRRQEQSTPPAAIWSLADAPNQWVRQGQGTESRYFRNSSPHRPMNSLSTPYQAIIDPYLHSNIHSATKS
jgi:hypothetical protein